MKSQKMEIMDWSHWMRLTGISMVALACATLSPVSLAGEHPEHPTSGGSTTKKEVAASAVNLDGKTFVGQLGEKGKAAGDKDDFVFKNGKFLSTACVKHGFHEAGYAAKDKDGGVEFTSEPVNASSESMSWKGTISGDQIGGTALYRSGAKQIEYWFKGTLKSAGTKSEAPAQKESEHPEHPK
jgi:hypothetical protein